MEEHRRSLGDTVFIPSDLRDENHHEIENWKSNFKRLSYLSGSSKPTKPKVNVNVKVKVVDKNIWRLANTIENKSRY